ncbi:MAG TPA: hypothetical protein DEB53_05480 [Bacillus pumilus]|nr:hypothetical protein [Bacillus pumilus]
MACVNGKRTVGSIKELKQSASQTLLMSQKVITPFELPTGEGVPHDWGNRGKKSFSLNYLKWV